MVESKMEARFPSGFKVQFRHLQHDQDAVKWNGKNIGDIAFDEATFFTEFQFWQMLSCMRAGGRPRFRLSMNPDPSSWLFQFVEPYLNKLGTPEPSMSGKVRWFGRKNGKLVWFDSREAALSAGVPHVMSFAFIPSKLEDNPILLAKSPEYATNLYSLPPLERARYADGNWRIKAQGGSYFQSSWFPRISANPLERAVLPPVKRWFWCMDLAGSVGPESDQVPGAPIERRAPDVDPNAKKAKKKEPDWSVILLMAQLTDGRLVVWDVWRYRDAAGAVEWKLGELVKQYKVQTKAGVVVQWQDPAQAGLHQGSTYAKTLKGHSRLITTLTINPELLARLTSRAVYSGQIILRDAAHNLDAFMRVLEGYPHAEHDDDVSALALAVVYALESPPIAHTGAIRPQVNTDDITINPRWTEY